MAVPRKRLTLISGVRGTLVDADTKAPPRVWRGRAVTLDLGFFQARSEEGAATALLPMFLDAVSSVTFKLTPGPTDSVAVCQQTVAGDVVPLISAVGWKAGTERNVSVELTAAQLNLDLLGKAEREFHCVIYVIDTAGIKITTLTGRFILVEDGADTSPAPPPNPGTGATLEELIPILEELVPSVEASSHHHDDRYPRLTAPGLLEDPALTIDGGLL